MRNRDPASFSCILNADCSLHCGLVSFGREVIQPFPISRSKKGTS